MYSSPRFGRDRGERPRVQADRRALVVSHSGRLQVEEAALPALPHAALLDEPARAACGYQLGAGTNVLLQGEGIDAPS